MKEDLNKIRYKQHYCLHFMEITVHIKDENDELIIIAITYCWQI